MKAFGIVNKGSTDLTVEDLKAKFPAKKATVTQELADLINSASNDPIFNGDEFIKTLADYQTCMIETSSSIKEYVNAIKFCAYLESEDGCLYQAYKKARCNDDFVKERENDPVDSTGYNAIIAASSRYRKNPLVKKILTQADMPLYLMFQGARYKAVALLAREMEDAAYSKDRINAADKLLSHVKPPENMDIELTIGPSAEAISIQDNLSAQLALMAANQKKLLASGMDIREVQKTGVDLNTEPIDVEVE
ncbi:hypothetical protein KAR91_66125 [Candidatus Pacearchaeota archaeon]|nr:hypothetical protein [Candidatus Pacearchaeota archaeon]